MEKANLSNEGYAQLGPNKECIYAKRLSDDPNTICFFPQFKNKGRRSTTDDVFSMCMYSLIANEIYAKDRAHLTGTFKNINSSTDIMSSDYPEFDSLVDQISKLTIPEYVLCLNTESPVRNLIDNFIQCIRSADIVIEMKKSHFAEFSRILNINITLQSSANTVTLKEECLPPNISNGDISLFELDGGKYYGMLFIASQVSSVFPNLFPSVSMPLEQIKQVKATQISNLDELAFIPSFVNEFNKVCPKKNHAPSKTNFYCAETKEFQCMNCECDYEQISKINIIECAVQGHIKNYLHNITTKINNTLQLLEKQKESALKMLDAEYNAKTKGYESIKGIDDSEKMKEERKGQNLSEEDFELILKKVNTDLIDSIYSIPNQQSDWNQKTSQIRNDLEKIFKP